MNLSDHGITTTSDGRIRTNGGEVRIPRDLLDLDESAPKLVHLPGSEDVYPEFFTQSEFRQYLRDMIE